MNPASATGSAASATASAVRRWEDVLANADTVAHHEWACLLRLIQAAHPDRPRIGYGLHLKEDPVRFGQPPYFHSPGTTVAALRRGGLKEQPHIPGLPSPIPGSNGSQTPWLYAYHFGLFGPAGPLPLHLTEYAYRRSRGGPDASGFSSRADNAFRAFCDVLTHRFVSFFFRSWADARKEIELDRPTGQTDGSPMRESTTWSRYVGSLMGIGLESLSQRDLVPDHAKLYYSGRFMMTARNQGGLESILADYFKVPVRIIPFFKRRIPAPASIQCRLGSPGSRLDGRCIIGDSLSDCQSGFRIRIGPLTREQFQRFLPRTERVEPGKDEDGFEQIHDWVRLYVGKQTDPNPRTGLPAAWDLQLVLKGSEVPLARLGKTTRLGMSGWTYLKPPSHDVDDLILTPKSDRLVSMKRRNVDVKGMTSSR